MKFDSLYKGIITIFIANAINLIFSLVNGFVLPKYLSIDSYASIKTYQLYLSYIGILHLGYIDGIYLLYGGKETSSLDRNEVGKQKGGLFILQLIMSVILLIVATAIHDDVLIFISFCIIPFNITQYFKLLYQATGAFKDYSFIMNMSSLFIFLSNLFLLFLFHSDSGLKYALSYTIVYYIIWLITELIFRKKYLDVIYVRPVWNEFKKFISEGFPLMLGNFSSILMTSTDRWFVKILMPTLAFAQYSFAVSIENLLNVVVTPISTTLYNFFCTQHDDGQLKKMHDIILVFSTFVVIAAFPIKLVVDHYIGNYSDSLTVLFILFASNIFLTINKCFYVNLYKSQKKQNRYFKCLISVIVVGVILNTLLYSLMKTKESFAIATLISSVIWFGLCRYDFQFIQMSFRQYVYIFIILISFLFLGLRVGSKLSILLYLLVWVMMTFIFENESLKSAYKMSLTFIKQKIIR